MTETLAERTAHVQSVLADAVVEDRAAGGGRAPPRLLNDEGGVERGL